MVLGIEYKRASDIVSGIKILENRELKARL